MKRILFTWILTVLTFVQAAFGADAPLLMKGQSESTYTETYRLQTPNRQETVVGTSNVLLETGNDNVLINPSFEATAASTGWTAAGTAVAETTEIVSGKKSLKITLAAYTGDILVQSYTPTEKWAGLPIKASQSIKTSLSNLQFCLRIDSVDVDCIGISNTNSFQEYLAAMPGQDGVAHAIVLKSVGSVTGDVYVDKSELGVWPGAKSGAVYSPWSSKTFTITSATGTITNAVSTVEGMRIGDSAWYKGRIAWNGSPGTWATPRLIFPSGETPASVDENLYQSSATLFDSGSNWFDAKMILSLSSGNYVISFRQLSGTNGISAEINQVAPFTWANGDQINFMIGPVKIQQWVGNGSMNYTTNPVQDYQVVAAKSSGGNQSVTADVTNITFSSIYDPSGSWNGSQYTAKVTGNHTVSLDTTANGATSVVAYINGTTTDFSLNKLSGDQIRNPGTAVIYLQANQSLSFRSSASVSFYQTASTTLSITPPLTAKNVTVPQSVVRSSVVQDSASGVTTIDSGTWTPTFTNQTNLSSSSLNGTAYWQRIGKTVTVRFLVTLDPTSGSNAITQLRIGGLPFISSNFSHNSYLLGLGSAYGNMSGRIIAITSTQVGEYTYLAADADALSHSLEFTYQIP